MQFYCHINWFAKNIKYNILNLRETCQNLLPLLWSLIAVELKEYLE